MSRIVALGEPMRLDGFALAGVNVVPAEGADELRTAWSKLDPDVCMVILTPAAKDAVNDLLALRPDVIWTTLPD
jgi:vacuolar-type H+-ATPase subunit F/Vma7